MTIINIEAIKKLMTILVCNHELDWPDILF